MSLGAFGSSSYSADRHALPEVAGLIHAREAIGGGDLVGCVGALARRDLERLQARPRPAGGDVRWRRFARRAIRLQSRARRSGRAVASARGCSGRRPPARRTPRRHPSPAPARCRWRHARRAAARARAQRECALDGRAARAQVDRKAIGGESAWAQAAAAQGRARPCATVALVGANRKRNSAGLR